MIRPVTFKWQQVDVTDATTGEVRSAKAMVPLVRYGNLAARQYEEGEDYTLVLLEDRSQASHNFYFAMIQNGFNNLPENIAARWPSAEHLRKWLLIEAGWFDEKEFDGPNEDFCRRLATFVRTEDEYARISVHKNSGSGWKVIIRRAKSQAKGAMKKAEFEASKQAALELLEHMIGVPLGTLKREAGKSA